MANFFFSAYNLIFSAKNVTKFFQQNIKEKKGRDVYKYIEEMSEEEMKAPELKIRIGESEERIVISFLLFCCSCVDAIYIYLSLSHSLTPVECEF